jgi:hypothetical protein
MEYRLLPDSSTRPSHTANGAPGETSSYPHPADPCLTRQPHPSPGLHTNLLLPSGRFAFPMTWMMRSLSDRKTGDSRRSTTSRESGLPRHCVTRPVHSSSKHTSCDHVCYAAASAYAPWDLPESPLAFCAHTVANHTQPPRRAFFVLAPRQPPTAGKCLPPRRMQTQDAVSTNTHAVMVLSDAAFQAMTREAEERQMDGILLRRLRRPAPQA